MIFSIKNGGTAVGDCTLTQRKGKIYTIYDFVLDFTIQGKSLNPLKDQNIFIK